MDKFEQCTLLQRTFDIEENLFSANLITVILLIILSFSLTKACWGILRTNDFRSIIFTKCLLIEV